MKMRLLLVLAVGTVLAVGGCSKDEPGPQGAQPAAPSESPALPPSHPPTDGSSGSAGGGSMGGMMGSGAPVERMVVVPEVVQGQWQGVVLLVEDKTAGSTEEVVVPIGGGPVAVGSLQVAVDSFLPDFTMDGPTITSKTNDTTNPAAQVVVNQDGNELYSGWLFSMYPEAHPFEHEQYGILLKDFVPAEGAAAEEAAE